MFVGDENGHVVGIKTVLVNWTKDDTGRWVMNEVPGNSDSFAADLDGIGSFLI